MPVEAEPQEEDAPTADASAGDEALRSYSVAHVDGAPDWDAISVLDIDNQQWLDPVDIAAHAQLCYDDEASTCACG